MEWNCENLCNTLELTSAEMLSRILNFTSFLTISYGYRDAKQMEKGKKKKNDQRKLYR